MEEKRGVDMADIVVKIDEKAASRAEKILSKYNVKLEDFINKLVHELLLYDLEEVNSYIGFHNYGEMSGLDKLVNGFMDLFELGILTHTGVEQYILDTLDTNNYWLEDYGLDLDEYSAWFLFMGSGLVDEFVIDIDNSGVTLTAVHSIEDLVSENPSIISKLEKIINESEYGADIVVEEDELRVIVRAKGISDLPKIADIENIINDVLVKAGISRK